MEGAAAEALGNPAINASNKVNINVRPLLLALLLLSFIVVGHTMHTKECIWRGGDDDAGNLTQNKCCSSPRVRVSHWSCREPKTIQFSFGIFFQAICKVGQTRSEGVMLVM